MNDNDLISRAAVLQICRNAVPDTNPDHYDMSSGEGYGSWMYSNGEAYAATRIQAKVEKVPVVDAALVVRCEVCKYAMYPRMAAICSKFYGAGGHGFFCAAGERRDDDDCN